MAKTSNAEDLARHLAEIAKRFASLAAALGQAARELQVSGTLPPKTLETLNPASIIEGTTPFAALLTLIDSRDEIDDDRFATLEDTVKQAFGRPMAVAATRGKLVIKGTAAAAPPASARPAAAPPAPSVSAPSPAPAPAPSAPQPRTLEEAFRAATPSGAPA